ncbi:MAG: AEC family transporter [Emcibacteraceae bacterium]|nr:AEC family transporter [Emcibacteraceae bacterium]
MLDLTILIAPIFLIILLGKVLRVTLISEENIWFRVNSLSYWVLFPSLLFNKTSVIDLNAFSYGYFSYTLLIGFCTAFIFSFLIGKWLNLTAASLSSVLQGSGRHNSFVALAVASQYLGEQGELIGTIAVAVLVTFSNIVTVIMMTSLLKEKGASRFILFKEILRNPFIIAITIGLIFNVLGLGNLPVLHSLTASLGGAALTLALLCVGAGLRFGDLKHHNYPAVLSAAGKLLIFPVAVYFSALYFELPQNLIIVAVIFASAPTSSASYALAKQLGGDAPLMATIISLQTLLAVFVIPIAILLVS